MKALPRGMDKTSAGGVDDSAWKLPAMGKGRGEKAGLSAGMPRARGGMGMPRPKMGMSRPSVDPNIVAQALMAGLGKR